MEMIGIRIEMIETEIGGKKYKPLGEIMMAAVNR